MHKLYLQPADLENMRFAYSPLIELVSSYSTLMKFCNTSPLNPWADEASRALYGIELVYINALIANSCYIADFLTPTPLFAEKSFEEALAQLYATPSEVIRENVRKVIQLDGETEIRRHFLARPREALDCLIEELRLYWQYTLAHHWERVQNVLENDVLYHARQMALHGIDQMFLDLSEKVSYENSIVTLKKHDAKPHVMKEFHLDGQGLLLVPMVFDVGGMLWQVAPYWKPMIIYNARGAGLWYRAELPEPDKALQIALGAGRARVLVALQSPAHTADLALRLNLTSGAISQHLQRLHQAGLVESNRSSHRVYYRLSSRGEKLVGLFTD